MSNYLNIHTTGFGYLNRARWVQVEGKPSYLSVTVAMKHGSKDSPRTIYFDCIVAGEELTERLGGLVEQINAGEVSGVFVLGDMNPETFVYKKGPKMGQQGISLKARIINVKYLKAGDEIIIQSESDASDDPRQQPVASTPVAKMPPVVKLSKTDPDFDKKRQELKASGYRWDREQQAWCLQQQQQAA